MVNAYSYFEMKEMKNFNEFNHFISVATLPTPEQT